MDISTHSTKNLDLFKAICLVPLDSSPFFSTISRRIFLGHTSRSIGRKSQKTHQHIPPDMFHPNIYTRCVPPDTNDQNKSFVLPTGYVPTNQPTGHPEERILRAPSSHFFSSDWRLGTHGNLDLFVRGELGGLEDLRHKDTRWVESVYMRIYIYIYAYDIWYIRYIHVWKYIHMHMQILCFICISLSLFFQYLYIYICMCIMLYTLQIFLMSVAESWVWIIRNFWNVYFLMYIIYEYISWVNYDIFVHIWEAPLGF